MIFFNYLKRYLAIYISSGIILAITLFIFILVTRIYMLERSALSNLRNSITTMRVLKKENDMLKKRIEELMSLIPQDYFTHHNDYLILKTIDEVKKDFPGYIFTVEDFSQRGSIMSLPFRINGELGDYTAFVKGLNHMENKIIPDARISMIRITVTDNKLTNVLINGEIRIPSLSKGEGV